MKKSIVAIVAFLYLAVTSGVVVNVHYCMGRIAAIDYGFKDKGECSYCGMKEKKGCCHTEHSIVKLQDVHQQAMAQAQLNQVPVETPDLAIVNLNLFNSPSQYFAHLYHSPPPQWSNSVYLHNNVFRI